jgi:pilus assembly protein Flp/PilA
LIAEQTKVTPLLPKGHVDFSNRSLLLTSRSITQHCCHLWDLKSSTLSPLREVCLKLDGGEKLNTLILKMYLRLQTLLVCDEGQDLVEYALVVALIAFGAMTGMGLLAKGLSHAFSGIASTLTADV